MSRERFAYGLRVYGIDQDEQQECADCFLSYLRGSRVAIKPRLSQTDQDGVLSMGTSLSILARGVAGRSLGTGASALLLEDAINAGQIVLLQLATGPHPEDTRMPASKTWNHQSTIESPTGRPA